MTMRASSILAALLLVPAASPVRAVVLTGKVRSIGAQYILVPPSMSSPVVLRYYAEDGTHVKKGQPILRIDAGQAAKQLQSLRDKIVQTRSKTDKDVADLEVKRVDAQLDLVKARAKNDKAALEAALPRSLVSGLDYDRYQGEYKRAQREVALDGIKLRDARAEVARRRKDGALSLRKLRLQLTFLESQVDTATVYAERDGTVVHDFQTYSFNGSQPGRYEQGSTAFPGTQVGQVVDEAKGNSVRAWALQPDRRDLKVGQPVDLHFDALPGREVRGRIRAISGATETKPEWSDGRYYTVDIKLGKSAAGLVLLPGMSVRVDTDLRDAVASGASRPADSGAPPTLIKAPGEIYARKDIVVTPPQIPGLWQMNITSMAGDGARVSKGQTIVVFGAGDLTQKLPTAVATLSEKKRTLEQLRLQLADKQRNSTLAVAKAMAGADKARRKTDAPRQYVAGLEYKKLLIDFRQARQVLALTRERNKLAAQSGKAQLDQAEIAVDQARQEVQRLRKAIGELKVRAPRAGILLHKSNFNGDKIDTGSQVWRGIAVADIPDMRSLAVRASLPERDLEQVRVGEKVDVVLAGNAVRRLPGTIVSIGNNVHSRSRAEPVPVVDLDIDLKEVRGMSLKPGQSVSVEITPDAEVASS